MHATNESTPPMPWQRSTKVTVCFLIAANLWPLAGVLFFGWDLYLLMLLYWLESGVIAFYNILKLVINNGWRGLPRGTFFAFHYGVLMYFYLNFIVGLFGPRPWRGFDVSPFLKKAWPDIRIPLLLLFISHGVSFIFHFLLNPDRHKIETSEFILGPYRRILLMHLTVVLGGIMVMATGQSIAALAFMVALKTAMDVRAHRNQHAAEGLRTN